MGQPGAYATGPLGDPLFVPPGERTVRYCDAHAITSIPFTCPVPGRRDVLHLMKVRDAYTDEWARAIGRTVNADIDIDIVDAVYWVWLVVRPPLPPAVVL